MKKIILIIFSMAICSCHAQKKNSTSPNYLNSMKIALIDNDKIKYSIVIMSCDTCIPISNIGYRVIINTSKEEEEIVKKLGYQDWMYLLNNEHSDWAANIILYNIFDKDAILLTRVNSRKKWIKYMKKDDLEFWKQRLTKK